jgi:hypothetical protein
MVKIAVVLASLALTASAVAAQCCGDCNGDGQVSINELITAVNNALAGCVQATQCCGDCNGDGQVTINELITAVNNALAGCTQATPTRGRTPTPTKKPTKTPTPSGQCPFNLTDNSSAGGGACTFLGSFNRGCGAELASNLVSNGTNLTIAILTMLDNPQVVQFYATVVNATTANLVAWSTDGISFNTTAGSVQLANNRGQLIIFPNDPPFMILGCNFVEYIGDYTGHTGSAAAVSSASDSASALERFQAWIDRPVPELATP